MRVAFIHHELAFRPEEIPLQRALAQRMMKSVRKHLGCRIVHLTDMQTPDLGADEVVRSSPKGEYFIPWLMGLFATQSGDVLFLDTDTVVNRDVRHVFDADFDVCVTVRRTRFAKYECEGKTHYMPFNLGVVFSKDHRFWNEIRERTSKMTDPLMLGWWGAQIELLRMYAEPGKWKIHTVEADEYNYTPNDPAEDLSGRAIVHYKGARKNWGMPGFAPVSEKREVAVSAL